MNPRPTERRRNSRLKPESSRETVTVHLPETGAALAGFVQDTHEGGLGIELYTQLKSGSTVRVTCTIGRGAARRKLDSVPARVVYCNKCTATTFLAGLEFAPSDDRKDSGENVNGHSVENDFYDVLQLSPKADLDTIHRVYRILAQRYHPDNQESGDAVQFRLVLEAYRTLSDPERRASYDTNFVRSRQLRWKIFDQPSAAQGREAEKRKRAGVLALLYAQRLNQPHQPALSIPELEDLLGCPREHLEFTFWYLREAGCVARSDNARYTITMKGVDLVEADDAARIPNDRLLTAVK